MADNTKATNYKRQFNAANYDRIEITVKKGSKEALHDMALAAGESLNSYIKNAIKDRYKEDTGVDIEL